MYKYKIPTKLIKKAGYHEDEKRLLHYKLFKVYPKIVLYVCEENGTKESFSKKDFIVYENPQKTRTNGGWRVKKIINRRYK